MVICMNKVILVDGNNLLFRSYYATAYKGPILRNSKGFPTNGLYGFINMLNKIIKEEKPSYMMIAFDKGKTFRHEKYDGYKDGRKETPLELKQQFPVAKEIARAMGIACFEIDNYEADDIIGTFAKEVDRRDDFCSTIISSDKDLLQLISDSNEVKLLKMNDFIRMDKNTFIDTYGFTPEKMVDLKAIMGDASDNIPGVKGIGEKGAINLIKEYGYLEDVYSNIDNIKGKTREKLLEGKDSAFFSKELATIYTDVPMEIDLSLIKYEGITSSFVTLLKEYEFFSLLNKISLDDEVEEEVSFTVVDSLNINEDSSIYVETDGNYHDNNVIGVSVCNSKGLYFIEGKNITNIKISSGVKLYTYDFKKMYFVFKNNGIILDNIVDDIMLMAYILNYNIKDDISSLMNACNINAMKTSELLKKNNSDKVALNFINCVKFIDEYRVKFYEKLVSENFLSLYLDIELPLMFVLIDMEDSGVLVNKEFLLQMGFSVADKIKALEEEIYTLAGKKFNIMSPKQLGVILFEDLGIPYPKKLKADKSYSTSADILDKLMDYEIVSKILDYRSVTKLYSNYILGIISFIKDDGKVHPIFNQTLTRTGRLSCTSPNLQNIPVREEYGKLIRKAFVSSYGGKIVTSDYSQIELRVFAHMSGADNLISAFNNDLDIHTKTAMDIYNVSFDDVTSDMRRNAKAVNFGILYGISGFGLSEDLGVDVKSAKKFIDDYLATYPGINEYMKNLKDEAYKNGYVKNLFGRVRVIEELQSSNFMVRSSGERMALNTPIQGTAADILKMAMINIHKVFKEKNLKARMIIQVHDELLIDCPNEEVDLVCDILKNEMENVYKFSVPLKVDIGVGNDWYDAK